LTMEACDEVDDSPDGGNGVDRREC
jgi:hypothetical protein